MWNIKKFYLEFVHSHPNEGTRNTIAAPGYNGEEVKQIPRIGSDIRNRFRDDSTPKFKGKPELTPAFTELPADDSPAKSTRARRIIKSEEDANTRAEGPKIERDKRRKRGCATIITQPKPPRITATTKKATTVPLWHDFGHVLPEGSDGDMSKHQGEPAMRCRTDHGSGWIVYASIPEGKVQVHCPEYNTKMTETSPFWMPPGRFVYQLRLDWGIGREGNVILVMYDPRQELQ